MDQHRFSPEIEDLIRVTAATNTKSCQVNGWIAILAFIGFLVSGAMAVFQWTALVPRHGNSDVIWAGAAVLLLILALVELNNRNHAHKVCQMRQEALREELLRR